MTMAADTKESSLPWVEKYRPTTLDEVAGHVELVRTLKRFVETKNVPHMLFYGPPGTGKTSAVLAMIRSINRQSGVQTRTGLTGDKSDTGPSLASFVLQLNASDDRTIEVVRERILPFVTESKLSGPGLKFVVMDEADSMTSATQMALRRIMELHSTTTRFCFVANYVHKIIRAIQSRCTRFRFGPLNGTDMMNKIKHVAKSEALKMDEKTLGAIVQITNGDMRAATHLLQRLSILKPNNLSLHEKPDKSSNAKPNDNPSNARPNDNPSNSKPNKPMNEKHKSLKDKTDKSSKSIKEFDLTVECEVEEKSKEVEWTTITYSQVYEMSGHPLPDDMDQLFQKLCFASFDDAFGFFRKYQSEHRHSLLDILGQLHLRLVRSAMSSVAIESILIGMAAIEYTLALGASETLQSGALVAYFIKHRILNG